jgi:hypothetical protein
MKNGRGRATMGIFGRRLAPLTRSMVWLALLLIGWHGVAGFAPVAQVLDLTPTDRLVGEAVQAALWLAHEGLRRLGITVAWIDFGCTPDA